MKEMDDFFVRQRLQERRREAFGDAGALQDYRFDNDNGSVRQLEQARR